MQKALEALLVRLLELVLPYYVGYMAAKEQKELKRMQDSANAWRKAKAIRENNSMLSADDVMQRLRDKYGR